MIILIIVLFLILFTIVYYPFFAPGTQFLGKVIFHYKVTNKKLIALTFDDGPNDPYTSQILNLLAKFNIKATFFPVGENIIREKETFKNIFNQGHEIGNHSYSHALFAPIFSPRYEREITKAQNLIIDIIGKPPVFFRPPWFFRNPLMLKTAKKMKLKSVTGTFASYLEVFQVKSHKITSDALRKIKPGTILVFHDGYNNKKAKRSNTVESLKLLIPDLLKSGYKFVTLSELLNMK